MTRFMSILLLCFGFAFGAHAAPQWTDLSTQEQAAFASLEQQWNTLDERQRDNLLRGLARWNGLDETGRQRETG